MIVLIILVFYFYGCISVTKMIRDFYDILGEDGYYELLRDSGYSSVDSFNRRIKLINWLLILFWPIIAIIITIRKIERRGN